MSQLQKMKKEEKFWGAHNILRINSVWQIRNILS